ncbi:MAG: transporter substrate-binding domain-containing protein [Candidatus Auribacterota bacterium]
MRIFINYLLSIRNKFFTRLIVLAGTVCFPFFYSTAFAIVGRDLVVHGDRSYPPYEYIDKNGNPAGFNIDLFQAVAKEMGLSYSLTLDEWNTVRSKLENGECDMLTGMFLSPGRAEKIGFSLPFIIVTHAVFVRHGSEITSIEECKDKEVIVQQSDMMHDYARLQGFTNIITVPSPCDALKVLSEGKHDCVLLGKLQGEYILRTENIMNVRALKNTFMSSSYCFAVPASDPELLGALNEGLNIVKRNGVFDKIYEKWFGVLGKDLEHKHLQEIIMWLAVVFLPFVVMLVVSTIWSYSLKQQVARQTAQLKEELSLRENAEKRLEKSEERLSLALDASDYGMWDWQIEDEEIFFSQQFSRLLGFKERDIKLRFSNWEELIHPEDVLAVKDNLQRHMEGVSTHFQSEFRLQAKNGQWIWVLIKGKILSRDRDNKPLRMTGTIKDITEEKKIAEELTIFRQFAEASGQGLLMAGLDLRITYANPELCRLLEVVSPEDIKGKNMLDFYQKEHHDLMIHTLLPQISANSRWMGEMQITSASGKVIPTFQVPFVIYTKQGKPFYYANIITDITEQKEAEKKLLQEKEFLDTLHNSIHEVILITTYPERRIEYANNQLEFIFGYHVRECIGKHINMLYLDDDAFAEFSRQLEKDIEAGRPVMKYELLMKRKDGSGFNAEINSTFLFDDGNVSKIISLVRDVTEKKKMEAELLQTRKLESLGVLAGGIAHDFNNLLAGIMGYINLAKVSQLGGGNVNELLTKAEKAAMRAKDLSQQLLTFSKGGAPIKEVADIAEIVEEAASFTLKGSNVKYECITDENLYHVKVDRGQISQVINNLVLNSRQAMPQGGIITLRCSNVHNGYEIDPQLADTEYVCVSIQDRGTGIAKEDLHRIFDPYFTTKSTGTGLGLATSYSIVKKHGGIITVESELGYGTAVSVYLPAAPHQKQMRREEKQQVIQGNGKVLVMDDEAMLRSVLNDALKYLGYESEFARDGEETIELYTKAIESGQPFDVVIMDLTIPGGMGGKEAIKKLHEIDVNVKAVASSGYSNDPIMANYKEYGFAGVVSKPFSIQDLSQVLHSLIDDSA